MYPSVIKKAKDAGFSPILLPALPYINKKTAYHADLGICILGDTAVAAPSVFERIKGMQGIRLIRGMEEPSEPYPSDIRYNALPVGKYLFCNAAHTDSELLEIAGKLGFTVINVKQGYARCGAVPIGNNALITSDESIYLAALKVGIEVLRVRNDGVNLNGFTSGFIGGTAGVLGNTVLFSGDISRHTDYSAIKDLCNKKDFSAVYTDEPLYDFGSLLC